MTWAMPMRRTQTETSGRPSDVSKTNRLKTRTYAHNPTLSRVFFILIDDNSVSLYNSVYDDRIN
jgi:hypothetical protein